MSTIEQVHARQILDSRGDPTVEVDVTLASGARGRAAIPSGASTGKNEAVEVRDGTGAYGGKGVLGPVNVINREVSPVLSRRSVADQAVIDRVLIELDGTDDKSRFGANTILGVSLAVSRARARDARVPLWQSLTPPGARPMLPMPMFNVINGGLHADNPLDVQEFMLIPVGAHTFSHALRMGAETYHALKQQLRDRGLATAVGDEGGFAPALASSEDGLTLLLEAIDRAGYQAGEDIAIAIDPAASELFSDGRYRLASERRTLNIGGMVSYWERLISRFPIVMLEDGMAEDDWDGWGQLTRRLGHRAQLVGDDVFVTNPKILRTAIDAGIANSVLVKPNQIGTLTETLETIAVARAAGYRIVISHRSGETEDTFIADLAVATGAGQIKAGAPARSERVAKYNRLLRIEEQLGDRARFASQPAGARAA